MKWMCDGSNEELSRHDCYTIICPDYHNRRTVDIH